MKETANSKSENGEYTGFERRRGPRLKPSEIPFLKSVSVNQGSEVQVIDISTGGILLETDVRLRPQMEVRLQLVTTTGVVKLEGRVLHSSISSLNGVLRYQARIAFTHPFLMLDNVLPNQAEESQTAQPESEASAAPDEIAGQFQLRPSAGPESDRSWASSAFFTGDEPGMPLSDLLIQNDW